MFNHYGHCSLDHNGEKHVIVNPPSRCPQCTLLWPCRHCAFSENRELVVRVAKDIRGRLARLEKYTLPHPSKALVTLLVRGHAFNTCENMINVSFISDRQGSEI